MPLGARFTGGLRARNQNMVKILIALILSLMIQLCYGFAQGMAAELSWHVQNYDMIWQLFCRRAMFIFTRLQLWTLMDSCETVKMWLMWILQNSVWRSLMTSQHWFSLTTAQIVTWTVQITRWANVDPGLFCIWVRSRNCGCLDTWFCYQLIAKPGNKTATVSWPDPYIID